METEAVNLSPRSAKLKLVLGIFVAFLIVFLAVYFLLPKKEDFHVIYLNSLLGNKPQELQDLLKKNVESGINDKYTKSAAYFVTHRYFDNKGNIYEIYDYAHSDPNLAFLNYAETVYPEIFQKIKNHELPTTFSEDGMYAYLGYLEAIYKAGYADVALLGTASNQYLKMAYISINYRKTNKYPEDQVISDQAKQNIAKGSFYVSAASSTVHELINGQDLSGEILDQNILVGLNQYASALRYLALFGVENQSLDSPEAIFAFTKQYSRERVPELFLFTNLLDASSLVMLNATDTEQIRTSLEPLMNFDLSKGVRNYSVMDRVLSANKGREEEGTYSKGNIVKIANRVPEFKNWLKQNGWSDSDFQ